MNDMEVYCIYGRYGTTLQQGEFYIIRRNSIWIDADGDAYASVYKKDGTWVGQYKLNHFCSC